MHRPSPCQWLLGPLLMLCVAASISAQEPAAPASTKPNGRQAVEWKQFDYTCEGGRKLTVHLRNDTVKVLFNNRLYRMRQVIAASGTRYSDGRVIWWSKGESGFLQQDSPDGNGAMIVKDCQLNKPFEAPEAVTGTVSYLMRSALPPNAVIWVQLEDVSRADTPATIVAEDRIIVGQHQVPVSFELKFDPAKIDPQHAYAIDARILVDDQLRCVNDRTYRVLTQGNPSHVEMILKPVEAAAPTRP